MADGWQDLTVEDLERMGMTLEDFEAMMDEGNNPFATDYEQLGVLNPTDISPQATQWDILDAQKTARESTRPPSQYERRLDRSSYGMPEDAFTYDLINQANPYIRALLNEAISGAEPGPNQAFDVREYVTGRVQKDEGKRKGVREGKTRIGQAAREAYDRGDFEQIADQFHQDDEAWATTDKGEQLELLKQWLAQEAEGALSGGAPSVSRNVNFSDWALNREEGEPFQYGDRAGFDREPQLQFDERYWGKNRTPGMEAQLGIGDFRKAYKGSLASQLGETLKAGQRIEDPNQGGYWVINENIADLTPLQRARMRNREREQRRGRVARNRKPSGNGRSWVDRNITGPLSSLGRFGR